MKSTTTSALPAPDRVTESAPSAPPPAASSTDPVRVDRRVLILSDAIPNRNGVGTYYKDMGEYLEDHGAVVEMIPAKANCFFRHGGISFPMPGDNTQRLHIPHIPRILRRARELKPHVIIAPTHAFFGHVARLLARRCGTRLVVGHHTPYEKLATLYWKGLRGSVKTRCMERISRMLLQAADVVVVNTNRMADEARQLGARKVYCVGTTIAKPFIAKPRAAYDGALRSVLYAGRLAPEKNIGDFVAAARRYPDLIFRMAGDGPLREELEREAGDLPNLECLGWLTREALLDQMDHSDLLVLPSHIESFGSVALEGMARGRLVLVSKECGILEWPELTGGLYAMEDGECLADSLARIRAEDPATRRDRAETAFQVTHDMNDTTTAQWLDILRDEDA